MKFRAIILFKKKKDQVELENLISDINARDHYQFIDVLEDHSLAKLKMKLEVKMEMLHSTSLFYDIEYKLRFENEK